LHRARLSKILLRGGETGSPRQGLDSWDESGPAGDGTTIRRGRRSDSGPRGEHPRPIRICGYDSSGEGTTSCRRRRTVSWNDRPFATRSRHRPVAARTGQAGDHPGRGFKTITPDRGDCSRLRISAVALQEELRLIYSASEWRLHKGPDGGC